MDIFTIKDGDIILNPEILMIKAFKVIWDLDKGRKKDIAKMKFACLYHYCDYRSPYNMLPDDERIQQIEMDILPKDTKIQRNKIWEDAVQKYEYLQQTPSLKLLKSLRSATSKYADYFNEIDFKDKSDAEVNKIQANMKTVGDHIQNLDKLEKLIQHETKSKAKGDSEIGMYETPDTFNQIRNGERE